MPDSSPHWYDDEAGPLVRMFAMTAGRSKSTSEKFDLMAVVQASPSAADGPTLPPEQQRILRLCEQQPSTVADIASESGLPVGVVRVLLRDLLEMGLIFINRNADTSQQPDQHILREVINGLRAL
ncbi:MAG: DUF742 domain-containing protein [Actinomycetota bacterium]